MVTYGDWIKQKREERGWTQAELALNSGVPQTTISGWERKAIIYPSVKHLGKIAKVFDIRLCEIPVYHEPTPKSMSEKESSCNHNKPEKAVF